MTRKEAQELAWTEAAFLNMVNAHQQRTNDYRNLSPDDFETLRKASRRLRGWFERECGTDGGCIERDEDTGRCYWLNAMTSRRFPIRDLETGARKRIQTICQRLDLHFYIQSDPRGAALYVSDQPIPDNNYTRALCIW